MKKDIAALCLLVVFGMGCVNILGRIHALEPVGRGEELELFVNVHNPLERDDFEELSVKAIFFRMGEYVVSNSFELEDGTTEGIRLRLDIPADAPKGSHLVKIAASNDDYYDSDFIYVNVI
ncbi:hypothetical protein GF323_00805 [Candidatus Woesearchaeota archaeon]|nr:hypothetical protein [Candidatus Woesearchaeota archaeon]